jgi:hypothetical protein
MTNQAKTKFIQTNKNPLFLRYEAQRRKYSYLSRLVSILFAQKNFYGRFNEISTLIILALNGSEEAYLDKKFYISIEHPFPNFKIRDYLKEIGKIHEILLKSINLNCQQRVNLLQQERELIKTYLEKILLKT